MHVLAPRPAMITQGAGTVACSTTYVCDELQTFSIFSRKVWCIVCVDVRMRACVDAHVCV